MNIFPPIFLTPFECEMLQRPVFRERTVILDISLDLGVSLSRVIFSEGKILQIPDDTIEIPHDIFRSGDDRTIFIYRGEKWEKWQHYNQHSGKYYKMIFVRSGSPPTIEISGIKMHITKEGDPGTDTANKLKTLKNIHGTVLDTCMGMGYTAMAAAHLKQVKSVFVCEKDPVILKFCQENPWSRELFSSAKIHMVLEPAQDFIKGVPDHFFNTIIHDPPRFTLAPELYSQTFYNQILRILKPGGQFYHYTGNPNKDKRRQSLAQKTSGLLLKLGFRRAGLAYAGVLAQK